MHRGRRGGRGSQYGPEDHTVSWGRGRGRGRGGDEAEHEQTYFKPGSENEQDAAEALPPVPPGAAIRLEGRNVVRGQASMDDPHHRLLPFGAGELGATFGRTPECAIAQVDFFAGADVTRTDTGTSRQRRPDTTGSVGFRRKARTNHFVFARYPEEGQIHQYSVKINKIIRPQNPQDAKYLKDAEVAGKGIRTLLLKEAQKNSGFEDYLLAFDGAGTLYTAKELPFTGRRSIEVTLPPDDLQGQERSFNVALRKASEPNVLQLIRFTHGSNPRLPQEVLQAFDIILRQTPRERYTSIGRFFYFSGANDVKRIDGWAEGRLGYIQSVRPIQLGLSLNINVSANAFYLPLSIIDLIKHQIYGGCQNNTSLNVNQHMELENLLKGLRVSANYNYGGGHHVPCSRVYLIDKLTQQKTSDLGFTKDGRRIKVVDYFMETYGIELKFLSLPCISTRGGKAYIPLEICTIIKNQRCTNMSNKVKDEMARMAGNTASGKFIKIQQVMTRNAYNNDEYARAFDMEIRDTPCVVNVRVLPTPKVLYKNLRKFNTFVSPNENRDYSWYRNNEQEYKNYLYNVKETSIRFQGINFSPVNDNSALDYISPVNHDSAVDFIKRLDNTLWNSGMDIRPLYPDQILRTIQLTENISREDLKQKIWQQNQMPNLLIFLMPDKGNTTLYGHIKYLCDIEFGIISQCCLEKNIKQREERLMGYCANVALKINIKFGGTNSSIQGGDILKEDMRQKTIIFGADVTHPASRDRTTPSIAAVVASLKWPLITNYACAIRTQESRQEIIQDLYKEGPNGDYGMILELIDAMGRRSNPPSKIIFYRDGVSEGQFPEVIQLEVNAIRQAYAQFQVNPSITFVVVQKRHQTRLFFEENQCDRIIKRNVTPGTVVDTGICHPREYNFFLCSHYGNMGTSRPAHYHVLLDENNFTVDQLQGFTYELCYSFQRCQKPISIVPPAYYAHLAAKRATLYLPKTEEGQPQPAIPSLPPVHETIKEGMFYC